DLRIENDTPRQQSGDLLEDYSLAFAFHRHCVLLIHFRTSRTARIEKLAALIAHAANRSGDRRPVHVYIEDAEKNANSNMPIAAGRKWRYISNLAIPGRNDCASL